MSDETVLNDAEKSKHWLIKPGEVRNPKGRPKGARNRFGEAFVEALANDFENNGVAVIETVRATDPVQYLKVCASILPKELNVKMDPLDDMTDDELIKRIRDLDAAVSAALGGASQTEGGIAEAHQGQNSEPLPSLH